jgi:hypothetical protein
VLHWAIRIRNLLKEDLVIACRQLTQRRSSNAGTLT